MNDVRDPEQVPARAELLLAAELGEDAPGRPIYARLEPDGDGEPAVRIKVGAVLTRRLYAAEATEATEAASGAAYGNPLRGRPGHAPSVPIGSALLARTDAADAHGWRVYRVTPAGTVMYDEWIDDDPANGGLALTQLRAAAGDEARWRRCAAWLRRTAATPTRPEDYAAGRAGRPLRNTRVRPRGLTPRRLAQLAGADPRGVRHATPDPWVPEPALVLSDVVAGPHPWTGMLLDPARPRPVPIGSLIRSTGPASAPRHWLVWPDARLRPAKRLAGTDPRSVAAYLDEPAMVHFARELDEAAVRTAMADQSDGSFDVRVIECAVAGGYGGDAVAADAVTAWIAETLRRGFPKGELRAGIPRAPGRRAGSRHAQRQLVCRWL